MFMTSLRNLQFVLKLDIYVAIIPNKNRVDFKTAMVLSVGSG